MAEPAAELRAVERQLVAEHVEQRRRRIGTDRVRLPVHDQVHHSARSGPRPDNALRTVPLRPDAADLPGEVGPGRRVAEAGAQVRHEIDDLRLGKGAGEAGHDAAALNGKQAAIRAGYAPASAEVEASRLLRDAKVAEAIEGAAGQRAKRVGEEHGITVDRVVLELAKIGFADIRDVVAWRSNLTEISRNSETGESEFRAFNELALIDSVTLDGASAAAIAETSQTKDGALKGEDAQQAGCTRDAAESADQVWRALLEPTH